MKKILALAMVLSVLGSVVAGCGKKPDDDTAGGATAGATAGTTAGTAGATAGSTAGDKSTGE